MSTFGSDKKMRTPDHLVDGSISWGSLSKTLVDAQASAWFEQYGPVPVKDTLRPGAFDADPYIQNVWSTTFPDLAGDDAQLSIPGLVVESSDLGEEIDLSDGVLGPALINALKDAGVSWSYQTSMPINHFESVELPNLKHQGVALWQTYFGTPIEQSFRVFRNSKGQETCLWSADMLAATRPVEHITTRHFIDSESGDTFQVDIEAELLDRGALTFGEWSTRAVIPQLAKSMFFLAETPFPSNLMMTMGRNIAFGDDLRAEHYPRPVILNKHQSFARGAFDKSINGFSMSGSIMPHVIEMGWTFTTTNPTEILKIITVVSEGLTRIATILEDGFLNYRSGDHPFLFDSSLLSPSCFDPNVEHEKWALGLAYWVPVTRLGFLLEETNARASRGNREGIVDEQYWVAENGAGAYVPMIINTLVYSTLISNEEWFMIDRFLDASVRMDVLNESTNSLSNWGIAKYKQGLLDEAIEKFELALSREDKYADAEASFYLAKIYSEQGNAKKSLKYEELCALAGGYEEAISIQTQDSTETFGEGLSGLTKSSKGGLEASSHFDQSGETVTSTPQLFCGSCGVMYQSTLGKFCQNCGQRRNHRES
jgi:hypothetical protein